MSALKIEYRTGGPVMTNCYLLTDTETGAWALVDPVEDFDVLFGEVITERKAPQAIIVTHGHFDHIGGLADARERYPDAPVWVHPDSAAMTESAELSGAALFGLPLRPAKCTDFFKEGDRFQLGNLEFAVLDTPGHCPGSVTLVCDDDAIVGDVLFAGSVGRYDLPGASYDALAASIREKLMPLPDQTHVWPGHGPATTIGEERQSNWIVREMLAGRRID